MRMMVVILMMSLFGSSLVFQLAEAEIYKWVDEKGTVHFTDDPATIPEKYRDKAQSRDISESPEKRAPFTSKGAHYNYPPQRQLSVPKQFNKDEQECGLGEYETNVFMMRYLGGGRSPLAPQCRDILKKCCNYSHREFADLVDKYAKNAKWEVIPGKIPRLLRMYCGQTEPDISSESHTTLEEERRTRKKQEEEVEEVRRKKQNRDAGVIQNRKFETNPTPEGLIQTKDGAIDTRTGEFYPGAKDGIISPRTGEFMPDVGGGYIDPKTGKVIPKQ